MNLLDEMFELLYRSVAKADDDMPTAQYCRVCRGRIDAGVDEGHTTNCRFMAIAKRYRRHQAIEARARGRR